MKKVILLAAGVSALGLAGCSQLFKVSSPQRKPGLWEETVQSDRAPAPMVSRWCFDAASDRRAPVLPRGPRRAGACQKFQVSKSGDSYVVDSVCGFGGANITNHSMISGDFSSKYTIVSNVNVSGSSNPARNGEHKTTVTAVFKGACPPEIGPGQVQLPSGEVLDMAAMRGFRGGGGGPGGGGPAGGNSVPAGNSAPAGGGGPSGGGGPPAGGGQ